jgi:hypothetical protein
MRIFTNMTTEQTEVAVDVVAQLRKARAEFDKNPSGVRWTNMIRWSFAYQQIKSESGMHAAVEIRAGGKEINDNFPDALCMAMYGQSVAEAV